MRLTCIILFTLSMLFGQARIGDWNSYTSPLNVHETVELGNLIIGTTDGGLLLFDTDTQLFETLNNIDGLKSTKLKSIEIDNSDNIWIGGGESNGFVQIYDVLAQESINIFDYDMSEIIDFAISDSIIYAVYRDKNDFGIIELNYFNGEFNHKDIYPNWPNGNRIHEIEIIDNFVFAATDIGLYRGELGDDPNNWKIYFPEMSNPITIMKLGNDNLYCYSDDKMYKIDLDDLELSTYLPFAENSLKDFVITTAGTIIGVEERRVSIFADGTVQYIPITNNSVNSLKILDDNRVVLGTTTGIAFKKNKILSYFIPNAPLTNNLQAITLFDDGRIVAAGKTGIAIKEMNGWRNIVETNSNVAIQSDRNYNYFIADSIPVDFGVSVAKMVQGPDGFLYCAIEGTSPKLNGGGVIIIDIDDPANFTAIDTTFLDYFSKDYLVVKDIEFDRAGNLWIADPFASNKHNPLHVRTIDGKWHSYNADESNHTIGLTPSTVAIDAWKRVWVGSFQDSDRNSGYPDGGLAMLSYTGNPEEPDDFQWKKININSNNSNNTVWSLAVTPENRLYMLTPVGLTFLDLQFSNDDPIKYESPRYYFPNISFGQESEVRLDANNNAWTISGSDGIHVLLNNSTFWPDNDENLVIESIDTDNYPLLSNNVTDIIFDNNKGIAHISSNRGINSFRIPFAAPRSNYSDLRIFPSPYHIPSDKPLIIDNLKENSSIKVMTISGEVIRRLESAQLGIHGFQIQWDGKDESGNWVGSGVYLFSVYDESGANQFSKIVVIKH